MSASPGEDVLPAETPLRTLRIDLQFDGTDFEGWQRQARGRTVQGDVEAALEQILGAPHAVVGCGRTDAGVHAHHLIASFRTAHTLSASDCARALDAVTADDIGIVSVREVEDSFHARRSAAWKWYRYTILRSRRTHPLLRRQTLRLGVTPPLDRLQAAAAPLVGRHDFRSFANTGSTPGPTTRSVHVLAWSEEQRPGLEDPLLHLDVVGEGFLYKMVRTLVGTMLQAAGEPDPGAATARILAARQREAAGPAVPARGLTLRAVAVRGEPIPSWVPETLGSRVESIPQGAIGGTT